MYDEPIGLDGPISKLAGNNPVHGATAVSSVVQVATSTAVVVVSSTSAPGVIAATQTVYVTLPAVTLAAQTVTVAAKTVTVTAVDSACITARFRR